MDPFSTLFSSPVLCVFKPNLPLPVPVSRSSFGQKQWQRCPITTTFALGFQWYSSSCSTLWACLQWSVWQKLWSPSSWICSRRSRKNEVTNSSKILDKKHKSYWIQNKNFELTVCSRWYRRNPVPSSISDGLHKRITLLQYVGRFCCCLHLNHLSLIRSHRDQLDLRNKKVYQRHPNDDRTNFAKLGWTVSRMDLESSGTCCTGLFVDQ